MFPIIPFLGIVKVRLGNMNRTVLPSSYGVISKIKALYFSDAIVCWIGLAK